MPTTPQTDFGSAAERHLADASLLHAHARPANADHLAGLAAECALKALIVGFLGGHVDQRDYVVHPHTGDPIRNHIDTLWLQMPMIMQNRSANALVPLLATTPFADWHVKERYSDGSHLTPSGVAAHLAAARTTVEVLTQAKLDGILS